MNSVLTNRREVCGETDDVFLDLVRYAGMRDPVDHSVALSLLGELWRHISSC